MWINEMLTIWLYGSLFALALIAFSLFWWYRPDSEARTDRRPPGAHEDRTDRKRDDE